MQRISAHDNQVRRSGRSLALSALIVLLLHLTGCGAAGSPSKGSAVESAASGLANETPVSANTPILEPTFEATPSKEPTATATTTPTDKPPQPTHTPTARPTLMPTPTATNTLVVTPIQEPTPVPRAEPRLMIPALNVDAVVVPVGLDASGAMAAPTDWFEVGWFRYGPRPGFAGSAALAGHLDTNTGAPATFWDLGQLTPGQEIIYQAEDGSRFAFVVDEVATYPWDQVPLDRVFARDGDPRLSLITCGGAWSREHRNYSHRTIVYASLR